MLPKEEGIITKGEEEWEEDAVDVEFQKELEQEREIAEMVDALKVAQENMILTKNDSYISGITEKQGALPSTAEIDDITGPQDPLPTTAESDNQKEPNSDLTTQVKKICGDGRCLFCSVAAACDIVLLPCAKNEGDWPKDAEVARQETELGDKLRKRRLIWEIQ